MILCVSSRKVGVSDWGKREFVHHGWCNSQDVYNSGNAHPPSTFKTPPPI